ncbi:hypothetical protein J6590_063230 [Homalodisca vitripennis]|nr:hypothetical protein J6590_063230 [Homalodisca vitripennis]
MYIIRPGKVVGRYGSPSATYLQNMKCVPNFSDDPPRDRCATDSIHRRRTRGMVHLKNE